MDLVVKHSKDIGKPPEEDDVIEWEDRWEPTILCRGETRCEQAAAGLKPKGCLHCYTIWPDERRTKEQILVDLLRTH